MIALPPPLAPLAAHRQFILWRAEPDPIRPEKVNKIPLQCNGLGASTTNPLHWNTFEAAVAALPTVPGASGIGFVFSEHDPFFFLDMDNCLGADGNWSQTSLQMLQQFPGCAVETSHSGRGLHVFGSSVPGLLSAPGRKNSRLGLEFYTRERFVALTGVTAPGGSIAATLDWRPVVEAWFHNPNDTDAGDWTDKPRDEWRGPEDDDELIRRMLAAKVSPDAAFSGRPTISDYWTRNVSVLANAWPHTHDDFDQSSADSAFAALVAWWTGGNHDRTERVMRKSAMVREKWDRESYLRPTILKAASVVKGCYVEQANPLQVAVAQATAKIAEATLKGEAIPGPERGKDQVCLDYQFPAHFGGCVYVMDQNRIFDPKTAALMNKSQMDAVYGGFSFFLSPNGQAPTRSAWDAFLGSSHFIPPMATQTTFHPQRGFGEVFAEGDNYPKVNLFRPYSPPRVQGDPAPFLDLVSRILPDERDRAIFLSWMAALVQYPGVKFRWWPVLQGVKGGGKTFLSEVIKRFFRDEHWFVVGFNETNGDSPHNAWVENKLFLIFEEVNLSRKRQYMEKLKELVTNNDGSVNPKGVDQRKTLNWANGIILTNHRDGIPLEEDERRYAVFYAAQQKAVDLIRDGLTEPYFVRLNDWMRNRDGFAITTDYLATFPIVEEFNPATHALRGPKTSAYAEVLVNSRGLAEQEIALAIQEGRVGFRGGWVSGLYMAQLLDEKRVTVPPNRRRAMMQALGYDWHPLMRNGGPNNSVSPDGRRSTLYVRVGHPVNESQTVGEAAEHYTKMQLATSSTPELAFGA